MRRAGGLIAVLLTIVFLLVSIPYLVLTTLYLVQGVRAADSAIFVFVIYALGLIVVVLFWIRVLSARRASGPDR